MKAIYNNNYIYIKNVITKIVKNSPLNNNDLPHNYYNSYLNYRKNEIDNYIEKNIILSDVKYNFENNFNQKDDWIKLLNIENIMYLSALNYEDLDLESDSKYELLRDSLLEKVIMLTVAYFCLSNELRYLSKDKYKKTLNGEYYLYKALNLSILFLPVSCPITRNYIATYNKNYGQGLDIIPEGEIIDYKIDLIKKEIEPDIDEENNYDKNIDKEINKILKDDKKDKFIGKDVLCFSRVQKVKRILKEKINDYSTINNHEYRSKSNSYKKDLHNFRTIKRSKYKDKSRHDQKEKSNTLVHSAYIKFNSKNFDIINITEGNLKGVKHKDLNQNFEHENTNNSNSLTSSNISIGSQNKENTTNEKYDIIQNSNYIERVNKSKISDIKAPKFKLNFHNINLNSNLYDSQNINNDINNNSVNIRNAKKLSSEKKNKKSKRKEMNSEKKRHIPKINIKHKFNNKTSVNIQLNHNHKTNEKINININNIDKKNNINNNDPNNNYPIKSFNKISLGSLGYKTERSNIKDENSTIPKTTMVKKPKSKNTKRNNKKNKKNLEYTFNNEKSNNINNISNLSKYFNIKNPTFIEKEILTDRFIVKINRRLKEKGIKINKNNSNSPYCRREFNNHIYNNYIKKKRREKNPIKLIQSSTKEDNTIVFSGLYDYQKNNLSNINYIPNKRNFYSNDSNIDDYSEGTKKVYKLNKVHQGGEKKNPEKDRINKYLKNINLLKKLISNNNKNDSKDKTFNEINVNIKNNFYKDAKKKNISNNVRVYTDSILISKK